MAAPGRRRGRARAKRRRCSAERRQKERGGRKRTNTKGEKRPLRTACGVSARGEDAAAGREPPDPAVGRARPRHARREARRKRRRREGSGEDSSLEGACLQWAGRSCHVCLGSITPASQRADRATTHGKNNPNILQQGPQKVCHLGCLSPTRPQVLSSGLGRTEKKLRKLQEEKRGLSSNAIPSGIGERELYRP
ncbi:unnamed protein product [Prorocentrum cordatum]|uniref:PARP-type domain-containing protein n=1 Tax=Prorocentrum cordatum TaxID=2364126 RepID=A0ABN9UNF1_9DINO|nr:unnamed protein product [Polarella glacialis]